MRRMHFFAHAPAGHSRPNAEGSFRGLDWGALTPALGEMVAAAAVTLITVLFTSTSVGRTIHHEADLDHELRVHGLANMASALLGGFVGQITISNTMLSRAAGGWGRSCGIVVGVVMLAALMGAGGVISYVARFVLSGALFLVGGELL